MNALVFFESLFHSGAGLAFPCDTQGHVQLDALSDRAKSNYMYAQSMVGREYATPRVTIETAKDQT